MRRLQWGEQKKSQVEDTRGVTTRVLSPFNRARWSLAFGGVLDHVVLSIVQKGQSEFTARSPAFTSSNDMSTGNVGVGLVRAELVNTSLIQISNNLIPNCGEESVSGFTTSVTYELL